MLGFIVRRILASLITFIVASYLMYILVANSGDPLRDLRVSADDNREQLLQERIQALDLGTPPWLRWFGWFGGVVRCVVPFASCDLGQNVQYQQVTDILPTAMMSTIQLVTAATFIAIFLGVTVGIVTALRQYSGFDVSVTALSFFLYSLPSFLAAVLLKEFLAIRFNDFLQDPVISLATVIGIAVVAGFIWQVLIGGPRERRLGVFAISGAATGAVVFYMSASNFFLEPGFGPVGLLLLITGVVLLSTVLVSGLQNRRALIAATIAGVIAYICFFALQGLFDVATAGTIVILGLITIGVSILVGFVVGGIDRSQAIRAAVLAGFVSATLVFVDRVMQAWPAYMSHSRIRNRPIATTGGSTPRYESDFWGHLIDNLTHYTLPTIALVLISFALYTRYSRAGMLEVMNQDYIRTARAKGLPERTVVMRHAFRNTLIPLSTIVAADVGTLLGGAIITEQVFSIAGMGQLFNVSLRLPDLNPIMGYFLVIASLAILFNFLADLSYAALDPRVRVK